MYRIKPVYADGKRPSAYVVTDEDGKIESTYKVETTPSAAKKLAHKRRLYLNRVNRLLFT